jgi:hypothetical protein
VFERPLWIRCRAQDINLCHPKCLGTHRNQRCLLQLVSARTWCPQDKLRDLSLQGLKDLQHLIWTYLDLNRMIHRGKTRSVDSCRFSRQLTNICMWINSLAGVLHVSWHHLAILVEQPSQLHPGTRKSSTPWDLSHFSLDAAQDMRP